MNTKKQVRIKSIIKIRARSLNGKILHSHCRDMGSIPIESTFKE